MTIEVNTNDYFVLKKSDYIEISEQDAKELLDVQKKIIGVAMKSLIIAANVFLCAGVLYMISSNCGNDRIWKKTFCEDTNIPVACFFSSAEELVSCGTNSLVTKLGNVFTASIVLVTVGSLISLYRRNIKPVAGKL